MADSAISILADSRLYRESSIAFHVVYDEDDHIWYAASDNPIRCAMTGRSIPEAVSALFERIWSQIKLAMRTEETAERIRREEGREPNIGGGKLPKQLFGRDVSEEELSRLYEVMRYGSCGWA